MYLVIDDVTIEADFSVATTTTTEPEPTTTTVPPTTTTTTMTAVTTTIVRTETTTTTKPNRTVETSTTTTAPVERHEVSPEDHHTMMDKTDLAIVASMPPMALPTSLTQDGEGEVPHAEPVEALAAAFFTESGSYGGNLLPSVVLGVIIAVLTLAGIGHRNQD